ncbi:MAG: hypothetical protein AAF217_04480 [Pseudomonadota bacterium]
MNREFEENRTTAMKKLFRWFRDKDGPADIYLGFAIAAVVVVVGLGLLIYVTDYLLKFFGLDVYPVSIFVVLGVAEIVRRLIKWWMG